MKHKKPYRFFTFILALVLAFGMTSVSAAAQERSSETECSFVAVSEETDGSEQGTDNDPSQTGPEDGSEEQGEEDTEETGPSEDADPEADPEDDIETDPEEEGMTDPEEEAITDPEEDIIETAEENLADPDFRANGKFSCEVTDPNGTVIRSIYDKTDDTYYLYLTNTQAIAEFQYHYNGYRLVSTTAGTLDTEGHYLLDAFHNSGDSVTLTAKNGKVLHLTVLQSTLPGINIDLNGVTLSQVHAAGKDVKYKGSHVVLNNGPGSVEIDQGNVEFKGRGNSTWLFTDKKSYQIKFEEKTSVLGMAKAKKWVLLANAFDDTMVRNKTAIYMSQQLQMAYTPNCEFVDLWINGEYRGTYTIGEKAEIGKNRLNLQSSTGILLEQDEAFYDQEEYWFKDKTTGRHFAVSEVVDEDTPGVTKTAMQQFKNALNNFSSYLFNTSPSSIKLADLNKYIDVDSFAKWFLVNEYLLNVESFTTSFFWYMDGPDDVIHLGPNWDFDSCQGNYPGYSKSTTEFGKGHPMFERLLQVPAFSAYVDSIFNSNRDMIGSLGSYGVGLGNSLSTAAAMNYTRWKVLGTASPKHLKDYAATYGKALNAFNNWHNGRYAFYLTKFSANAVCDGKNITVEVTDRGTHSRLKVKAWTKEGGQDDVISVNAQRSSSTAWKVVIPVSSFKHTGKVRIKISSAAGFLTEVNCEIPTPTVETSISPTGHYLTVNVNNAKALSAVQVRIWNRENGQDDLETISLTRQSAGKYSACIDLRSHGDSGKYTAKVVGKLGKTSLTLKTKTYDVCMLDVDPELTCTVTDQGIMRVRLSYADDFSDVVFKIRKYKQGAETERTYTGSTTTKGKYYINVSTTDYTETGKYRITATGVINGKRRQLAVLYTEVNTLHRPKAEAVFETGTNKVNVTLYDGGVFREVRLAVWGDENGQNDLTWYKATKNAAGDWKAQIDLGKHGENGDYHIHIYGKNAGVDVLIKSCPLKAVVIK